MMRSQGVFDFDSKDGVLPVATGKSHTHTHSVATILKQMGYDPYEIQKKAQRSPIEEVLPCFGEPDPQEKP